MLTSVVDMVVPTEQDSMVAGRTSRALSKYRAPKSSKVLKVVIDREQIKIPAVAMRLFVDILDEIAAGHAVSLTSVQSELTTQQAADLLNVSRPYFVSMLERGELPYRKVGTKRRVLAKDIIAYKNKIEDERLKVLEKLTRQAQKLGMGY